MDQQIWLFGNPDRSDEGFPLPADMEDYIREDIFAKEKGRYRYTQIRDADVIVLSRGGLAYGHFEIDQRVPPTDDDRIQYRRVKQVYIVRNAVLYRQHVQLSQLGIANFRWGYRLSDDQFRTIVQRGGIAVRTSGNLFAQDSTVQQERVLREIRQRLGQSEFRKDLLKCYGVRCAITGCDAEPALEAAHIRPYCGRGSNLPANGLLLRGDIHALFDLHLLAVHPETFEIFLDNSILKTSYGDLQRKMLRLPSRASCRPDRDALEWRWLQFSAK